MHRSSAVTKRSLDNEGGDMDGFDGTNAAKRHQIGSATEQPSRVVLLRNLARGVTEVDLDAFVQPFTKGYRPKIYLQASAGHAFVEFVDEEAAHAALEYFRSHSIQLKGTTVQATYSKRDAVTTMEEKVEPFRVLLASVTNLLYPVDIDLMYFLFSKYGTVEKIVTFSKTPTMYQALVQFAYAEQSKQAMLQLHNRNIYDGCNTLQIQPSRLQELVVKQNCAKSWDYTQAAGPAGDYNNGRGGGAGGNQCPSNYPSGGVGPGLLNTPGNSVPMPQNNFGGHGHVSGYGGHMGGFGGGGAPMRGLASNLLSMLDKLPKELRDLNLETTNAQQTPVIIVYNLSPQDITVQKLFNLFSLYGTVFRIKILREKPDTALIQYSDPLYATIAHNFLQGAPILGRDIQISFSKNHEVKLPPSLGNHQETEDDTKRTKAFSMKDQRYGQGDDVEKYVKGACRPTQTIFVANINDDCTEEDLTKLFADYGTVMKFQFKPPKEGSRTQMGIIEMGSEIEAMNALMNLHNYSLNGRYIKVAFSKTVIA